MVAFGEYADDGTGSTVKVRDYKDATDLVVCHEGQNVVAFKPGQSASSRSIGAQEGVACTLEAGGGGNNVQAVAIRTAQTSANGHGIAEGVSHCLDSANGQAVAFQSWASASNSMNLSEVAPTLDVGKAEGMAVAFAQNSRNELREMAVCGALAANPGMKQTSYLRQGMTVRRLTPLETERLQGFPDFWTAVPYRGKPAERCPDSPRYKAVGNSWAVNCARWIGRRIEMVNEIAEVEQ